MPIKYLTRLKAVIDIVIYTLASSILTYIIIKIIAQ